MEYPTNVDQLLDEWESCKELDPTLSLDDFIRERLAEFEIKTVEEFRSVAQRMIEIDRRLSEISGFSCVKKLSSRQSSSTKDLGMSELQPGLEPVDGFTLVSRLGRGGFGEVWKARTSGGFHVALKFVQIGGRVGDIERKSLEVIKNVRHPNLLFVFNYWEIGDLLIIASELADCTVYDRLIDSQKRGHTGIQKEELLQYLLEAAKGIDALNGLNKPGDIGIQHRDIKPHNLLLSSGSIKVGDFGLARAIGPDSSKHTSSVTFAYAAPECFEGKTSSSSDQYSLAITYCQLRGGRLPFEGTHIELMDGHRHRKPDLSMIPENERWIVEKALSKRPIDRWRSCCEFAGQLSLPTVSPAKLKNKLPRKITRKSCYFGLLALLSITVVSSFLLVGPSQKPRALDVNSPPLNITSRSSQIPGYGFILNIQNVSKTSSAIVESIRVTSKNGKSLSQDFRRKILPAKTVEVGWSDLQPWKLQSGDIVEVHCSGAIQPVTFTIPELKSWTQTFNDYWNGP